MTLNPQSISHDRTRRPVIAVENSTWNNIGDAFYQTSICQMLARALPQCEVVTFDGPIVRDLSTPNVRQERLRRVRSWEDRGRSARVSRLRGKETGFRRFDRSEGTARFIATCTRDWTILGSGVYSDFHLMNTSLAGRVLNRYVANRALNAVHSNHS